jgi:GNAT superfamily N-acetyltransferase
VPRTPKKAAPAKKKTPAKQLEREIEETLAKRPDGNGGMERITRERVHEALMGERITRREPIEVTLAGIPSAWDLIFTVGKMYGGGRSGRILIVLPKGGVEDPLAGLAYSVELDRPYVHHFWVDSDARGRGLAQVLFDAYRSEVSPELVVVGPFTKAGRAAAERAGATIEE